MVDSSAAVIHVTRSTISPLYVEEGNLQLYSPGLY